MPVEVRAALALAIAGLVTLAATPAAVRVARARGFLDHPGGAKGHDQPTPYLGGAAVLAGVLATGLALADGTGELGPVLGGATALWAVGTADDRWGLEPAWRVLAEAAAAVLLWGTGVGWDLPAGEAVELVVTVGWVIALCNAFNLLDNIDGAAATAAAAAAAGTGVLAAIEGAGAPAALALGVAGACAALLTANLAAPARIFLGDGGSLPLGFLVAAVTMALPLGGELGWAALATGILLAGVVLLDTALVVVSRLRRGVSVLTGGRDHLTHRLLDRLGSARRVALVLLAGQGALCVVAVLAAETGRGAVAVAAAGYAVLALTAIAALEAYPSSSP